MMLFETQVKKSKPRSGADVVGLGKIAQHAPVLDGRERSAAIGNMLFKMGGGVAVRCANPRAVRPPAPDDRTTARIAVGKYFSPPVLRAIQKSRTDPQGSDHFNEPQPRPAQSDIDFMWSPAVSADLRAALVHAVKERTGAERIGTPYAMLQWDNSCADLKAAIEELIERIGPPASALSQILNGGGGGGALALTRAAALARGRGASLKKFFDVTKAGDGDDELDNDDRYPDDKSKRVLIKAVLSPRDAATVLSYKTAFTGAGLAKIASMMRETGFKRLIRRLASYKLPAGQQQTIMDYLVPQEIQETVLRLL